MSYDICMVDGNNNTLLLFIRNQGGSNLALSSDKSYYAEISPTWNYAPLFYKVFPDEQGIKWLNGKTGAEALPVLAQAIIQLGGANFSGNYWDATPGNAACDLKVLANWCMEHPTGIFEAN